jgi:hypothetical protein
MFRMFRHRSGILAAIWILGAGSLALMADVNSIWMAALVVTLAILPPFLLLHLIP